MTILHRLGWAVLAVMTLAIALASSVVTFPEPRNAIVIDQATLQAGDEPARHVTLPPSAADRRLNIQSGHVTYRAHFDLATISDEPLFLLVPATSQGFSLTLNGEPLYQTDIWALWSEPMVRGSSLIRLPRMQLRPGDNELTFVVEATMPIMPSYLGRLYIGDEDALASNFKLRLLLEEQLKTMALAAQALLGIAILIAYLYRPRDALFSWLAATTLLAFIVSVSLFAGVQPEFNFVLLVMVALTPTVGLLLIGVALALVGLPRPLALSIAAITLPAISIAMIGAGVLSKTVFVSINISIFMMTLTMATAIIVWGAVWRKNIEALFLLFPVFLLCWFSIRDAGVMFGLLNGSILLAPYVRPMILAAILAMLMRRLAMSLDKLDRANEDLHHRLAERETELAALHQQDRMEATRLVREQERLRLTRDLHDGISGHLVSIIAMAERPQGDAQGIEQAARDALEDLRLVIYSLDLDDRELPLALANFRERLIPRLRRIGVELEWSIADLPDVAGVTPANALGILRILQEALTNALKHGPARKIIIKGAPSADGMVAIMIENDGKSFVSDRTGLGIDNMCRRARHLGGAVKIESLREGTRVTLTLPLCLPDLGEAQVS